MTQSSENQRLTEKEYWNHICEDSTHASSPYEAVADDDSGSRTGILRDVPKRLMNEYVEKHFQADSNLSILEVGSAPGRSVLAYHLKFGYRPFGVEYTEAGAEVNRQTFTDNGISPDNVIQTDFLGDKFQTKYKDTFDHVVSFGFIEHFGNPKEIVDKHINVLKPGGTLLITIPNFRYLNYVLRRFYYSDFVSSHNLDLMTIETFSRCFASDELEIIDCSCSGGFRFPEPTYTAPWKRFVEKVTGKLQLIINILYNTVFARYPIESRYFSYQLVCVGKKKIQ